MPNALEAFTDCMQHAAMKSEANRSE